MRLGAVTSQSVKFASALGAALLTAACNTSGTTITTEAPAQPLAAPPAGSAPSSVPFGAPGSLTASSARPLSQAPSQQHVLHSQQTQKVTVSADGRTVRTDTTRTSVSVNPDRAAAAVGAMLAPAAGTGAQGLPGSWKAFSSSNRASCAVQLYGPPDALSGSADSTGCAFGSAMHGITGWQFSGGQLIIKKGGETSLTLNPAGPNRYDGKLTWGIITTTISLYR